jgi:DNA-binding MarR family transcriptional regulator
VNVVQHRSGGAEVDDVVREFVVASRVLVGIAARSLASAGDVTLPQFRALVVLSVRPTTTVSDLAAVLDVHPTTATRLIDRLVRKRLVRRTGAVEDRRITHLRLTAAGARLVQRITSRRASDVSDVVRRMPREQWPAVIEALAAFADAAGEPDDIDLWGWTPPVR